jgi:hypothetical protein
MNGASSEYSGPAQPMGNCPQKQKSNFLVTAYEASSWPFFITEQGLRKLLTDNGLYVCPCRNAIVFFGLGVQLLAGSS